MIRNDSPKISVVVPVYNVEKYIHRCVDSLINQTLTDIEIILVDDGSPDNCSVICNRLAEQDSRIKVVHKQNGGLSSARNAGMKIATGDYIGFVDSDDDVEPDMYEKMFRVAEQHNVDFIMADYLRFPSNGEPYLKTLNIDGGYYNREKIIKDIFPQLIMGENIDYGPLLSVWHCLYNRQFLEDNSLVFDEEVRWSEDNIFNAIMGYNCNSFYYMKGEGLYHYYNNPGTITTSYRKGAWRVYKTMNEHLHNYFDGIKDYDFSPQLKLHLIYYVCNCIGQAMTLEKKQAINEISNVLNDEALVRVFKNFVPDKTVQQKLKIQLLLMKHKQSRLLYLLMK